MALTANIIPVTEECIEESSHEQRIDNFFLKKFKYIPKSHIYRLIRSGQVRVNGKRITVNYRLQLGDYVRIPPIRGSEGGNNTQRQTRILSDNFFPFSVIHEDDAILVIDKPCGMAVHGGSGISFGVIEQLRAQNPDWKFLELVHRLDRETSGILLLAKKRSALVELHRQIREGMVEKHYLTMVKGKWLNARQHVKLPLNRFVTTTGERRVAVATTKSDAKALYAYTIFTLQKTWTNFSLLDAEIKTGRTHQIRVHLAHLGYPIVGDDKYGDFELNKQLARKGINGSNKFARMFLHASSLQFIHPISGDKMKLQSSLSGDLQSLVACLDVQ